MNDKRQTILAFLVLIFLLGLLWLASVVPPFGPLVQMAEAFPEEEYGEPAFPHLLPLIGALIFIVGAIGLIINLARIREENKEKK